MRSPADENASFWISRWETEEAPRWDHGEPSPPLIEFSRQCTLSGRVLAPGCGSGHDVRLLAEQGADVTGLDVSSQALEVARAQNSHPRASYVRGDFLQGTFIGSGEWDWIYEHTCFCAIDPSLREEYADSVRRNLKSGGKFLAIFYLQPASESGPPFGVDPGELDRLFSDFECLQSYVPNLAWESRRGREQVRLYQKPSDTSRM